MTPSGDGIAIRVVIIIILLRLSAFFSPSGTALTTVNKIRIRTLAEGGNESVQWVMKLSENQGRMLNVILIGNNVVNPSVSSTLTALITEISGNKAVGVATGVLTSLILILGEITPKTMATLEAKRYSLRVGYMIHILMAVLTPLIIPANRISLIVFKALHVDPDKKNDDATENELRIIVDVGHEKSVTESEEREMINNVSDLGDSVAEDVMVPRIDMVFVDIEADYDNLVQIFKGEHYTRFPVYKETADNVMGITNIKDLLLVEDKVSFCVSDCLRQPLYTFESKKLSELMMEVKRFPNNTIIVLDEYGVTAEFITLEDILEEIAGDIRDEYDKDEEEELVDLGDGQYLAEGSMKLDDFSDILDLELSSEDYDSVGGLAIDRLEHLPPQGEGVMCDDVCPVVEQVEKNRIDRVHLYVLPEEKEESMEGRRDSS